MSRARILLAWLALPALAQAGEVTQARYDTYVQGFDAGDLVVTLTRTDTHIEYEAIGTPSALARAFGKDTIIERGRLEAASLRPLWYLYEDAERGRRYEHFYDWQAMQVRVAGRGEETTLDLADDMADPVALTVRSMLRAQELPRSLRVLSRGRVREYRIQPPRRVSAGGRELREVEVEVEASRRVRMVSRYDPGRDGWLVELRRWDNGAERYRIQLVGLARGASRDSLRPLR